MASKWFWTDNGNDKPRVTIPELIELWNKGEVTEKTYVWHKLYCKQWTPISHVSVIMDQIDSDTHNKHHHRMQPSIIRPSNQSLQNLPKLPQKTTTTNEQEATNHHHHYMDSNNTSEINEILVNDHFEGSSDSEINHQMQQIAPHIVDPPPQPHNKFKRTPHSHRDTVRGYTSTSHSNSNSYHDDMNHHQIDQYTKRSHTMKSNRLSMV